MKLEMVWKKPSSNKRSLSQLSNLPFEPEEEEEEEGSSNDVPPQNHSNTTELHERLDSDDENTRLAQIYEEQGNKLAEVSFRYEDCLVYF